jgi:hypothetical protein
LITLKIAVFALIPSANETKASAAKAGFLSSARTA